MSHLLCCRDIILLLSLSFLHSLLDIIFLFHQKPLVGFNLVSLRLELLILPLDLRKTGVHFPFHPFSRSVVGDLLLLLGLPCTFSFSSHWRHLLRSELSLELILLDLERLLHLLLLISLNLLVMNILLFLHNFHSIQLF